MAELSTLGSVIKTAYSSQSKAFTDALYDKLNAIAEGAILPNQLLYGSATWLTGLTFQVSAWSAVVAGIVYTGVAEQVTLSTANGSNPRIDIIAVNIDGTADVVTGTAAADPAKPEIDPNTQVEMTFVLVATSATTPSGVANTSVYEENIEWTSAVSGGTVDAANTSDPYGGTKDIRFNAAANGAYVTLTAAQSYGPTAFDRFIFRIKNISYGTAQNVRMRVALFNTATRVSNWIDLRDTNYGFSGTSTSTYQFIQIPLLDFGLNGASFNRVRFEVAANGGNTISFYLDNIFFQTGTPVTNTTDFALLSKHNVYNKAQGSGITILTDAATVSWGMVPSNVYQLTLGGNRTIAAPTNIKPGYKYTLFLYQDGTGSRTVTWNGVFIWPQGTPTLSKVASAVDVIEFTADASGNLHGVMLRAPVECWVIACGDELTAITTGNGKVTANWPNYDVILIDVQIGCVTAPTGAGILVDVNEAGTTVFSTRPGIDVSETHSSTGTAAVISDAAIAANAALRIDFDQVGSTIAGAGVKVYIYFRRK